MVFARPAEADAVITVIAGPTVTVEKGTEPDQAVAGKRLGNINDQPYIAKGIEVVVLVVANSIPLKL